VKISFDNGMVWSLSLLFYGLLLQKILLSRLKCRLARIYCKTVWGTNIIKTLKTLQTLRQF